jgi:hypothetical protein
MPAQTYHSPAREVKGKILSGPLCKFQRSEEIFPIYPLAWAGEGGSD